MKDQSKIQKKEFALTFSMFHTMIFNGILFKQSKEGIVQPSSVLSFHRIKLNKRLVKQSKERICPNVFNFFSPWKKDIIF
jgi:hypothetical protein